MFLDRANCLGAAATADTAGISPVYKYGSGITSVSFPSRLLGVAVGVGCTFTSAYTNADGVAVAGGAFPGNYSYTPTVLTTFDQGTTWQARVHAGPTVPCTRRTADWCYPSDVASNPAFPQLVTGFSTTPLSFAQTRQPQSNTLNGPLAASTFQAYPAPDMMSVHCTTRSLCFAVGGYFGAVALFPTLVYGTAASATTHLFASTTAGVRHKCSAMPRVSALMPSVPRLFSLQPPQGSRPHLFRWLVL